MTDEDSRPARSAFAKMRKELTEAQREVIALRPYRDRVQRERVAYFAAKEAALPDSCVRFVVGYAREQDDPNIAGLCNTILEIWRGAAAAGDTDEDVVENLTRAYERLVDMGEGPGFGETMINAWQGEKDKAQVAKP